MKEAKADEKEDMKEGSQQRKEGRKIQTKQLSEKV